MSYIHFIVIIVVVNYLLPESSWKEDLKRCTLRKRARQETEERKKKSSTWWFSIILLQHALWAHRDIFTCTQLWNSQKTHFPLWIYQSIFNNRRKRINNSVFKFICGVLPVLLAVSCCCYVPPYVFIFFFLSLKVRRELQPVVSHVLFMDKMRQLLSSGFLIFFSRLEDVCLWVSH